ncbi:hypothetical protein HN51_023097 [Arachis hypogaea]
MQIFSAHVRNLWNEWEIRVLVLLSLTFQVILIIFGSKRKHARNSFISIIVWLIYLSADWIATVSLGTLANNLGDENGGKEEDRNKMLQSLWAPFLLLHLASVAFYIFLLSWTTGALSIITVPVFVSGIEKYAERTWVLRSTSSDQFEDSLILAPTPQPLDLKHVPHDSELQFLHQGYSLFPMLKRLYASLSLRFAEGQRNYSLMVKKNEKDEIIDVLQQSYRAFKLVEVQLSFLYDVLYTKAPVIYSLPGLVFRSISIFSIVSALVAFVVFVDTNHLSKVDVCITYALFVGAVSLELYAFLSLILSDWTMRWLTKKKSSLQSFIICWASHQGRKRWSGCMSQHNLLSFCMKKRVANFIGIDLIFRIYLGIELYWQRQWKQVDNNLKKLIFQEIEERHKEYDESRFDYNHLKELLSYRGNHALTNSNCFDQIGWSVEVEFGHSLLIWHIATDICYDAASEDDKNNNYNCKASKSLSDYMLYVLLMRPFLLPKWIDRITHVRDSFREAIRILQRKQFPVKNYADASRMLIQMYRQSYQPLKNQRGDKSGKSVLIEGCRLALQLQDLGCSWEMICKVWIEMLTYAASNCEWGSHAQQLRRGGELLTHVCLLMADLGLNQQFDIGRKGLHKESQTDGWGWVKCKIIDPYGY